MHCIWLDDDVNYMHARYYKPLLGRFLSVDPAAESVRMTRSETWNRYTYAESSPLKYVDPTGAIVDLSYLSDNERVQVIEGINRFSGNTYSVNDDGHLQLEAVGKDSSEIATEFLNSVISSDEKHTLFSSQSSEEGPVNLARSRLISNDIHIDFRDFSSIKYGKVPVRALNLGAVLYHELIHTALNLGDPRGKAAATSVGPVVERVNSVRAELGLPLRGPAYLRPQRLKGHISFNFQNVNAKKPSKIYWVTVRVYD